jgi:hypothetical protein
LLPFSARKSPIELVETREMEYFVSVHRRVDGGNWLGFGWRVMEDSGVEAFKNTSMMIILAGIFYGAYQMFVSEPPNWKKNQAEQSEVGMAAGDPAAIANANSLSAGGSPPPVSGNGAAWSLSNTTAGLGAQTAGLPAPPSLPMAGLPTVGPANGAPPLPATWDAAALAGGTGEGQLVADGGATLGTSTSSPDLAPSPGLNPPPLGDNTVQVVGHSQPLEAMSLATRTGMSGPHHPPGPGLLPISAGPTNPGPTNPGQIDPGLHLTHQLKLAMESAAVDIQNGDWTKSLRELSAWYRQPLPDEDREHLVGWLDRLAGEVVYSTNHTLTTGHPVAAGETLATIAARYQMPPRLLARINQFPDSITESTPLQPGVELKVVPGPFEAEAHLSSGQLTLYAGGIYAGRFMFATGDSAPDQTIAEPISFVSDQGIPAQEDQRRHEPLAPTNPFGRYCLVVGQTAVLHSPGGNPQGSCLQFSEQDMQDLLILLPRGVTVRILP